MQRSQHKLAQIAKLGEPSIRQIAAVATIAPAIGIVLNRAERAWDRYQGQRAQAQGFKSMLDMHPHLAALGGAEATHVQRMYNSLHHANPHFAADPYAVGNAITMATEASSHVNRGERAAAFLARHNEIRDGNQGGLAATPWSAAAADAAKAMVKGLDKRTELHNAGKKLKDRQEAFEEKQDKFLQETQNTQAMLTSREQQFSTLADREQAAADMLARTGQRVGYSSVPGETIDKLHATAPSMRSRQYLRNAQDRFHDPKLEQFANAVIPQPPHAP